MPLRRGCLFSCLLALPALACVHSRNALMFRCLLFIAVFSVSACAQFLGLATPADGSRVYFATPLRQKDTTQPTYGKLFQVDNSGL